MAAEEVQAVPADGAAGVELFPEVESEVGALIFEIPNDQQAVRISVSWVDQPLLLK